MAKKEAFAERQKVAAEVHTAKSQAWKTGRKQFSTGYLERANVNKTKDQATKQRVKDIQAEIFAERQKLAASCAPPARTTHGAARTHACATGRGVEDVCSIRCALG